MLDKWADIVIAGKDVVHRPSGAHAYDVDFERKRLEFQIRQWEEEIAERKAQREAERLGNITRNIWIIIIYVLSVI